MKTFMRKKTLIVLATFSVIALTYAFTAFADDCTRSKFDDCTRACVENSFELKQYSVAATTQGDCPKVYRYAGKPCGIYFKYTRMHPTLYIPVCEDVICSSDYDYVNSDCDPVQ